TFVDILERTLDGQPLEGIPGTSVPGPAGETIYSARRPRLELEREALSSPFLDGTFDALLAAHPEVRWHAVLETHRGCPFSCSFCDWGSLIHAKIKRFGLEKVCAEVAWLGQHSIDYVFIADANFGVFPERDEVIVDALIASHQATGRPEALAAPWYKNSPARTPQPPPPPGPAGTPRGHTPARRTRAPPT